MKASCRTLQGTNINWKIIGHQPTSPCTVSMSSHFWVTSSSSRMYWWWKWIGEWHFFSMLTHGRVSHGEAPTSPLWLGAGGLVQVRNDCRQSATHNRCRFELRGNISGRLFVTVSFGHLHSLISFASVAICYFRFLWSWLSATTKKYSLGGLVPHFLSLISGQAPVLCLQDKLRSILDVCVASIVQG